MKHSMFWKLALILFSIVLVMELVTLMIIYNLTYSDTLKRATEDIKQVATYAADVFRYYDPYVLSDYQECDEEFDKICELHNIDHIYAIKPDVENRNEEYLALGNGENTQVNIHDLRHGGYIAEGTLTDDEIKAFEGDTDGVIAHEINEFGDTLICYMPVKGYFDSQTATMNNDKTVSIVAVELSLSTIMAGFYARFNQFALATILLLIVMVAGVNITLYFRVSRPLHVISSRMKSFLSNRDKDFQKLPVKGKDELAEMSNAFNLMAEEIDLYLDDVEELNRQKAEMNIAHSIQMGLLEPANYSCPYLSVCATILPAKDVGGDLYDYQLLGDNKIAFLIADVSDKGVSAALFMARAVTLLHQYAASGMSPGRVLYEYNNNLAKHNPNLMFITTFIGIYDPETKILTYANAGHNYPYLLSQRLTKLDGSQGAAAGVLENEVYPEHSLLLRPGDSLFLFTDGVTEAKNEAGELFGEKRLENALQTQIGTNGSEITSVVLKAMNGFTGEAEQNDDITILTVHLPEAQQYQLCLEAKPENLHTLNATLSLLNVAEETYMQLRLIAEEIFINICSYAYETGEGSVDVTIEKENGTVTLTFADEGKPYDPTKDVLDIETYDSENTIGGLGRFLTFTIADKYAYAYENGKNVLTIEKYDGKESGTKNT